MTGAVVSTTVMVCVREDALLPHASVAVHVRVMIVDSCGQAPGAVASA